MAKNKIIIFVEGVDDSKVWYEIIRKHNLHQKYFIISSGGTNLEQNFIDIEFMLNNICPNKNILYFGIFDYDNQGLMYADTLNSYKSVTKCYTLNSLNFPDWIKQKNNNVLRPSGILGRGRLGVFGNQNNYRNNVNNGSIEIENLLWNDKLQKWVDIGFFLKDYKQNYNDYIVANYAWQQLKKLIDQWENNF